MPDTGKGKVRQMAKRKINPSTVIVVLLCAAAVYFCAKKVFVIFLPFIIAYLLSKLTEPLMRFLHSHVKLPNWLSALLCTLLVVAALVAIVAGVGSLAFNQLQKLYDNWESIADSVQKGYVSLSGSTDALFAKLPKELRESLSGFPEMINTYFKQIFTPVFDLVKSLVTNIVSFVPQFVVGMIVTFLACYFMSRDRDIIRKAVAKILGTSAAGRFSRVFGDVKSAAGGYVKTQLTLMLIVFVILSIGLGIAGADYFLLIAFAIALLDALPVFGSGMVLIPWGAWMLLHRDFRAGITLIVLYLIIFLSRQILEPRILGRQIGIHPLITLVSMYAGLKLLGVFGMILGPVIAVIVKNLYVAGVFDRLKNTSKEL